MLKAQKVLRSRSLNRWPESRARRYVRHVKIYEMLRAAVIQADPIKHGEGLPVDYFFPLIEKKVSALGRIRPTDPEAVRSTAKSRAKVDEPFRWSIGTNCNALADPD